MAGGPEALLPIGLTAECVTDDSVDVNGVDVRLVRPSQTFFADIKVFFIHVHYFPSGRIAFVIDLSFVSTDVVRVK